MKAFRIIITIVLILFALGLLGYQYFIEKDLSSSDIVKACLIIAGGILSLVRPRKNKVINKKALYQKAYSQFIQNAFYDDPALEKKFYDAVHDFNQNQPDTAVKKLEKLRGECQRSADRRAVEVFLGLCLDDMGLYDDAIIHYAVANQMRPDSTLLSNIGLCQYRLGNISQAEANYRLAIQTDPNNACPYNNLGALYFKQGNYAEALSYSRQAIERDNRFPQALSTAAICCALLGDREGYENYYHRAVTAGYDGNKIKNVIRQLDPNK